MAVLWLGTNTRFPPVSEATSEGIVAIGGDLSAKRLLDAYCQGIFPWYSEGSPIIWWSPDPRLILFLHEIHISRSMRRVMNNTEFEYTFDTDFERVIRNCKELRKTVAGTWITSEMEQAYCNLHKLGFAHSIEVWKKGKLVGGLYGIAIGKCFFAESMFYLTANASKYALIILGRKLLQLGFKFIDCQVTTAHLISMGAKEIARSEFLLLLENYITAESITGNWNLKFC